MKTLFIIPFFYISLFLQAQEINPGHIDQNDTIIKYIGFTVCFDTLKKAPHYSSYYLSYSRLHGSHIRGDYFQPDYSFYKWMPRFRDFIIKGYDHGHLTPAQDMRWNVLSESQSFYFSNIAPQEHNFNIGTWKDLEFYTRSFLFNWDTVKIITGINFSNTFIPSNFWKIICTPVKCFYYICPNQSTSLRYYKFEVIPDTFFNHVTLIRVKIHY